jgi:hypothetical protein
VPRSTELGPLPVCLRSLPIGDSPATEQPAASSSSLITSRTLTTHNDREDVGNARRAISGSPSALRLGRPRWPRDRAAHPSCPTFAPCHHRRDEHSGVVPSWRALIVQPAPQDLEHFPVLDLAVAHVGNRNPVGATPTGVDQSITRYWNANIHVSRVSLLEILAWISTSVVPTPQHLTREFLAPTRVIEGHSSRWIRIKAELYSLAIWCDEARYAFVRRSLVKVNYPNDF